MENTMRQFKFKELCEMDGERIAITFDQAVQRAAADCEDRPGDDRARKVTIQFEFVPVLDQQGLCESVKGLVQIKETLPTRKSRVYDFGLRKGGMLTYSPQSLGDHTQQSMDFGEGE